MRYATKEDIPRLIELSKGLYQEMGVFIPYSEEQTVNTLKVFMSDPTKYLFLVQEDEGVVVGAIAGTTSVPVFSDAKVAVEHFLYVTPEHRSKGYGKDLIEAYYYWARLLKCKYALVNKPLSPEKPNPLLGYATETAYIKVL
jgi:GNAT superfamily N-acetyltransferase